MDVCGGKKACNFFVVVFFILQHCRIQQGDYDGLFKGDIDATFLSIFEIILLTNFSIQDKIKSFYLVDIMCVRARDNMRKNHYPKEKMGHLPSCVY